MRAGKMLNTHDLSENSGEREATIEAPLTAVATRGRTDIAV